jgi:hypothetical protein
VAGANATSTQLPALVPSLRRSCAQLVQPVVTPLKQRYVDRFGLARGSMWVRNLAWGPSSDN